MKTKTKKQGEGKTRGASWKQLLRFYTKVRIPWHIVILVALLSFGVKEAQTRLVPFTSKIMTGAITQHGFLVGFILMNLLYTVVEALQGSLGELGNAAMTRNVRHSVWGKLIQLPMSFYSRNEPQRLVSRVTQDTVGAYAAIAAVVQLLSVIYGVCTNFAQMYRTYKALSLIMLTGIPLSFLTAWIIGKLQYQVQDIINNAFSVITNFFGERLPNILHIKTCNMEDEEYKKGVEANDRRFRAEVRQENRFIFIGPLGSLAQMINQVVLLLTASAMVRAGTMQMYHLVSLYNYYLLFMSNTYMLTAVWQSVKSSHGACSTIARIMDLDDEDLEAGEAVPQAGQDIVFEDVTFGYEAGKDILKGVSFTIPHGKITAIVGENGSGKSTTLKLLERFEDVGSGAIRYGGRDIRELKLGQWRDRLGYLMQSGQIVKGSIRENIAYGVDRDFAEEELMEAVRGARALEFIREKENGFDTQISAFDPKCSGGEMQRLAVARMLLKRPEVLLMDEATSGVDVVSEAAVWDSIRSAMAGRTVVVVSHDMNCIRMADHIVVLDGGVVAASGSFGEVAEKSRLFSRFLAVQPT